jgi:hypothetical protein
MIAFFVVMVYLYYLKISVNFLKYLIRVYLKILKILKVCFDAIGFERIINLRGGIDAWAKKIDLSMPLY